MRGWTSETDLERQLGNGALSLYGRFVMQFEDVSLSIWASGIECWCECELAPHWHPLRAHINKWRDELRAFYETLSGDADDSLVLVGRWVKFIGSSPGTLVIYVHHIIREVGACSGPYTGGLAACDPSLGGAGFHLMLPGKDAKRDKAELQRHTRRRVLAENRRLGCADEPVVRGCSGGPKT